MGCFKFGLTPIVGDEMTHSKHLRSEGGYIADEAPKRMYRDAAKLGVYAAEDIKEATERLCEVTKRFFMKWTKGSGIAR